MDFLRLHRDPEASLRLKRSSAKSSDRRSYRATPKGRTLKRWKFFVAWIMNVELWRLRMRMRKQSRHIDVKTGITERDILSSWCIDSHNDNHSVEDYEVGKKK